MLQAAVQMLQEIRDGRDIPSPSALIGRMKAEDAARELPGFRYSILTYVAHAVLWQDIWLAQLRGGSRPKMIEDWRTPDPSEWPELRQRLLEGLAEAIALAEAGPTAHKKSEEDAMKLLVHIGIHLSYHLGQIKMIKRAIAEEKKANRSR